MERFGYLYTVNDEESDYPCILSGTTNIACVKDSFFKNLRDCIEDSLAFPYFKEKETRVFFKFLKTSDVIEHIYDMSKTREYGYLYLSVANDGRISLFSYCNTLFQTMMACVTSEKSHDYEDNMTGQVIKLAYFILFKDEDILYELQRPYV